MNKMFPKRLKLTETKITESARLWLRGKEPMVAINTGKSNPIMRVLRVRCCRLILGALIILLSTLGIYYSRPVAKPCTRSSLEQEDLAEVAYYCNRIDKGPDMGQEGSVSKSRFQLLQVHTVIRHGDRYAIHSLPNYDTPALSCDMERFPELEEHVPEVVGYVKSMKENLPKVIDTESLFRKFSLYPDAGRCESGHLTPYGAAQHVKIGSHLRKAYVDKWGLLSDPTQKQVEFVSTVRARTWQSGLALLYGLIPNFDMTTLSIKSVPDARMCVSGSKAFPCHCYAVQRFVDFVAGKFKESSAQFNAQSHVVSSFKDIATALGAPLKSIPRASQILDVAMVHVCHRMALPGSKVNTCMSPKSVKHIVKAINDNGQQQVSEGKYHQIARMRMLPLLHEILRALELQISGTSEAQFFLHSGHDTTIGPLLVALNVSDGEWPPYAARIVFEMYSLRDGDSPPVARQAPPPKQYFLRVLYQGKDITQSVVFCKGKTSPAFDNMCPLENYKQFIRTNDGLQDLALGSYSEACAQNIITSS